MKQNAQTNEQNPNKTHNKSNETQANPQIKKNQMKPTSQSLYGFRFSTSKGLERSTKKRKVRVMNLCCREK